MSSLFNGYIEIFNVTHYKDTDEGLIEVNMRGGYGTAEEDKFVAVVIPKPEEQEDE